nr:hypothetical protein [Tanacetum cinerariifolium]
MYLLNTLMATCATLSQKVAELEQDKHTQALEILKLKKRVKSLEKKKLKSSGFKRLRKGRINQDVSAATKDVSAAEPTVFDDEEVPPPKLTFYKAFFSVQWKFLIYTLVQCVSAKRTVWNEFSCSMASAVICLATGRKFNFSKYIFDSMKVAELEQDKHTQALEILKLKKRVKSLEKKKLKSSGFKRLRKGRINQDVSAATKDVSAAEPTVFDDEEVGGLRRRHEKRKMHQGINVVGLSVTAVGLRLMLLGKPDTATKAEEDPFQRTHKVLQEKRDKNQMDFVGGSWSDSGKEDDEKAKDETCLMAQASSEVHSESS